MADIMYLTQEGYDELKRELDELLHVRRPELSAKLTEAVSQGDLKENADYHDAKEQQAFLEGRINYVESTLRAAQIIQANGKSDEVIIGSKVVIVEEGSSEEELYTIVGAAEANPSEGRISNESPIGQAVMGKRKGQKFTAKTPGGEITFKVKKIN